MKGYEGLYKVSSSGRIASYQRAYSTRKVDVIVLSTSVSKNGYVKVGLAKNGVQTKLWVHRLVAEAFLHNPTNLPLVNHKDFNKKNNSVLNLEWCTPKFNSNHAKGRNRQNDRKARMKKEEVRLIMSMIENGVAIKEIADLFNCHTDNIYRIKSIKRKFSLTT